MPQGGLRHWGGDEGTTPVDIWERVLQAEGTEHLGLPCRTLALTLSVGATGGCGQGSDVA